MSSAGRGAGVTLVRGKRRRTPTRVRGHVDLRAAPVRATRYAAAASLRKTRGKVSQPGSPFSPVTAYAAVLAVKGSLAPDLPHLTAPGRRRQTIRYEKRWLPIGRSLRLPTRCRWSQPYISEPPRYTQMKRAAPCNWLRQLKKKCMRLFFL
jgi:hypothetical protein